MKAAMRGPDLGQVGPKYFFRAGVFAFARWDGGVLRGMNDVFMGVHY